MLRILLVSFLLLSACGPDTSERGSSENGSDAGDVNQNDDDSSADYLDPSEDPRAWEGLGVYELTRRTEARHSCGEGFAAAESPYFHYSRSDSDSKVLIFNQCTTESECADRAPGMWSARLWDGQKWKNYFGRSQYDDGVCKLSLEETIVDFQDDKVTANLRVYRGEFDLSQNDCDLDAPLANFSDLECSQRQILEGVRIAEPE